MGMRINYNGAAANAWRSLGSSQDKLTGSVEKLSSGLRINKGADDPAGLIISERLKSQITGLGQAIKNAQEATSLVQTGEGALTEMNNMLNKMRGLAVHSANAGVNDADTIAADQRQVDSALDSLQKISQNTKYQSKILLDGSATNTAIISSTANTSAITVAGSTSSIFGAVSVVQTGAASQAKTSNFNTGNSTSLTLQSSDHTAVVVALGGAGTQAANILAINAQATATGITASTGTTSTITFTFSAYGDNHNVTVSDATHSASAAGVDAAGTLTATKIGGTTTTLQMTGSGLDLTVSGGEIALAGTKVSLTNSVNNVVLGAQAAVTNAHLTAGGTLTLGSTDYASTNITVLAQTSVGNQTTNIATINALSSTTGIVATAGATYSAITFTFSAYGAGHTATVGGAAVASGVAGVTVAGGTGSAADTLTSAFTVQTGALQFSLGQDAGATEIRSLTIDNMSVTEIGKGATGLASTFSLNDVKTGGTYELSKDAANAIKLIDKAIDNVSITRANLGAFQQNALETTINTLSINKENLEASNSRIADVDMAQEMMQFTKNQILTQAGTAMLAQANQLPRSVMQLLQG